MTGWQSLLELLAQRLAQNEDAAHLDAAAGASGADVHAIGDGGFAGCTSPENIHQLSVSIKGRPYTYFRMASTNI